MKMQVDPWVESKEVGFEVREKRENIRAIELGIRS